MKKQESVRVMAFGMEAYPSAFQVHTVLNSFHFRSGIQCMYHMEYVRFVYMHLTQQIQGLHAILQSANLQHYIHAAS